MQKGVSRAGNGSPGDGSLGHCRGIDVQYSDVHDKIGNLMRGNGGKCKGMDVDQKPILLT